MNNKSAGTKFEKEFAGILAKHWFWVHLFQDNKNGQPCDVMAAKNGKTYLFDCKNCEEGIFRLDRIEENQYNAMKLFEMTGNGKGFFAIQFPETGIFLMRYDKLHEMQEAGFKRINASICRTQGIHLKNWLMNFEEGDKDASDDWK